MTRMPLPRQVESTGSALVMQAYFSLVCVVVLLLAAVVFDAWSSPDNRMQLAIAVCGFLAGAAASAAAAKTFPAGRVLAWSLGFLGQVVTFVASGIGLAFASEFSVLLALGMVIAIAATGWIVVKLFSGEIRRHFFVPGSAR